MSPPAGIGPAFPPKVRSLKVRAALTLAAMTAAILIAISLVLIVGGRHDERRDIRLRAEAFAQLTTRPLGIGFDTYFESGRGKFEEIAGDAAELSPDLERIRIVDVEGGVLSPDERRQRVVEIVREIEIETRQRIKETGQAPLGVRRILRQEPHDQPTPSKQTPKPVVHAIDPAVRRSLRIAFSLFRIAYRQASEDLRSGPDVRPRCEARCEAPPFSCPPM